MIPPLDFSRTLRYDGPSYILRPMDTDKRNILVALSGGVDSSVAAALLVAEGHNVTGAFMVNYDDTVPGHGECWRPDYRDALRVAATLGIPLLKLDFQKEYKEHVLDYLFAEYKKGRTPNPDVYCNKYVKFGFWLEKAKELGFDYLATGHYASVTRHESRNNKHNNFQLCAAKDGNKDQTYFLHQLNQEQLSRSMFPLGAYTKDEVRELAKKFDLPTAEKEESMGICFIGEVSMKDFLQTKISTETGDIVRKDTGAIIGKHEGLPFYTIGQRQGLDQPGGGDPLFVVGKDAEKNVLFVGTKDDPAFCKDRAVLEYMHWVDGEPPVLPFDCLVRFRHRQALQEATVSMEEGQVVVQCSKAQQALTPGQFAVMYKDGVCYGGGPIA